MGLDDLVPDDVESDSGRRTDTKSEEDDENKVVVQGTGESKKVFDEEHFEEVKEVIQNQMGLVPNKVLNNYPAQERYEIVHEAAMIVAEEKTEVETVTTQDCDICGDVPGEVGVEIAGVYACPQHPLAKLEKHLE